MPFEVSNWLEGFLKPAYTAYESGCAAFEPCRGLGSGGLGVDCDVISVTTHAKSGKRKSQKCDKLDARAVLAAKTDRVSEHTCVWCHDVEIEGARDLVRTADETVWSLKRAKRQIIAPLLRTDTPE